MGSQSWTQLSNKEFYIIFDLRDFVGSPGVKTPCSHCRQHTGDTSFISDGGTEIPSAMQPSYICVCIKLYNLYIYIYIYKFADIFKFNQSRGNCKWGDPTRYQLLLLSASLFTRKKRGGGGHAFPFC